MKKIAVVGTGYVGLVTGVGLSEIGHTATCIDIDGKKVERMGMSGSDPLVLHTLQIITLFQIKVIRWIEKYLRNRKKLLS